MGSLSNGRQDFVIEEDYDEETADGDDESGSLPALPSLTDGQLAISGAGGGGDLAELYKKLHFSGIIAGRSQVTFDHIIDFVTNCHFELAEEREALDGTLDLFWWVLGADCTNRQGRLDVLEKKAGYWVGMMKKKEEQEEADQLVNKRAQGMAVQLSVRLKKLQQGFEGINNDEDRDRWGLAKVDIFQADEAATQLTAAGHQYYICRTSQLGIHEERIIDDAKGLPYVDYTDVLQLLKRGKDIKGKEVLPMLPWPFQRAFTRGRGSKSDGVFDAQHFEALMGGFMAAYGGGKHHNNAPLVSIGGETPPAVSGGEKKGDD